MRKRIITLLLFLLGLMSHAQAQHSERDSVAYQTTFYFQYGVGDWIQPKEYGKMTHLLLWAKSDTITPIEITGWADPTGTLEQNDTISLRRTLTIQKYLVKQGIAAHRISFEGRGVDAGASSDEKARRADVRGVIRMVAEPQPAEPTETVAATPYIKEEVQLAVQEPTPTTPVTPQKEFSPQPEVAQEQSSCRPFAWYAGIELGMPLGVSTFTSFTPNGGVGFEGGIFGGYRFSPLLSLEAGISFGRMKLGASKCCEDYFLGADGVRYLEHVTGMTSYSYKEVYSSVSLQQYALRLNADLLQICNPDYQKRWSLTVSPAIYGIGTTATLKTIENKTTIIKRDGRFQFGAGVGIGAGYQITDNLGIGLRTGMVWVMGERYDGIAPTDHKENMIWNNTVSLTWRFGKMKNE